LSSGYRSSGVQEFRSSGVQEEEVTGGDELGFVLQFCNSCTPVFEFGLKNYAE
jgi:hypothetical protein